jgi:YidC/Oxa1 family membrane protein insertase
VETQRLILLFALVMSGMLLYSAWIQDYGVAPEPAAPAAPATKTAEPAQDVPSLAADTTEQETAPEAAPPLAPAGGRIVVETDFLHVEIGTRGAGLRRVTLLKYPVEIDRPEEPFVLLDDRPEEVYIVQGGLLSRQAAPTHEAEFTSPKERYVLPPGADTLVVPLTWRGDGIEVTKRYEFRRGSYLVKVSYEIRNGSGEPWKGRSYAQIQRTDPGRAGRRVVYTYLGAVFSSPENRYEKVGFDDLRDSSVSRDVQNGWVAMLQHYFVTALLPSDRDSTWHFYSRELSEQRFTVGLMSPPQEIAPGETGTTGQQIYVGPKLQHILERVAPGLELTVDYGVLWFIAKPLYWCLEWLHKLTGNWGWAIVLVTVLLKAAFFHLSAAGYRSMANVRRVQPRIVALRDRYKDDRARLNQAMMQLYKEEKINPLGGCLPILIQIPVFISLYWVLLESVEMRQAPWVLWIRDLSSPDPYWVLPVVMGVTMFLQQKLNPAAVDPIQQRVMQIMPIAFTIFFGFFPSGLVLYWVVNNILSIGQQWLITRSLEKSGKPPAKA